MTDKEKSELMHIAYAMQDYCTAEADAAPNGEILVPAWRVLIWSAKILDLTTNRKPNIYRRYEASYRTNTEFWNKRGVLSGLDLFKKDVEQMYESIRFVCRLLNAEKPLSKASHAWNSAKYVADKHKDRVDSAYKAFKKNPTEESADELGAAITDSDMSMVEAILAIHKNQFCKHWNQLNEEADDERKSGG